MALMNPDWGDESAKSRTIRLNFVPHHQIEDPHHQIEETLMTLIHRLIPHLAGRPIFEFRPNGETGIVYITFKHWAEALHFYNTIQEQHAEHIGWAIYYPMEADLHISVMTIYICGIPRQASVLDILSCLKNYSEDIPFVELKCRGDLTLEAFVTYANVEAVERIVASRGFYLLGACTTVSRAGIFKLSPGYPGASVIQSARSIIVTGLLQATTKENIMDKFGGGGQPVYAEMAWLGHAQIAYVTFSSPAAAMAALSDATFFMGNQISVKCAYYYPSNRAPYVSANNVMVQCSREMLFEAVSTHDILTVLQRMHHEVPYIEMHRDGLGNEVAYATFSSKAAADHVKAQPMCHVKEGISAVFKDSLFYDAPGGQVTDVPYFGVNDEIRDDDIFPVKLYKVLGMERFNDIVAWVRGGGDLIQIRNMAAFKTHVLPGQFNNMTFPDFKSRLKDYGFQECSEKLTWHHPDFKDGGAEYAAAMVVVPKKTVAGEVTALTNQIRGYGKALNEVTEQMRALAPKVDTVLHGFHGLQTRLMSVEGKLGDLAQDHQAQDNM